MGGATASDSVQVNKTTVISGTINAKSAAGFKAFTGSVVDVNDVPLTVTSGTAGSTVAGYAVNNSIILYEMNGSTGGLPPDSTEITAGSNEVQVAANPKNLTKKGYEFIGWANTSMAATAEYVGGETVTLTQDLILYAVWKQKTYTISFDVSGGSGTVFDITVTESGTYGALPTLTKDGFKFDGWYTAETGGIKVQEGDPVNLTEDTTLYARFTATSGGTGGESGGDSGDSGGESGDIGGDNVGDNTAKSGLSIGAIIGIISAILFLLLLLIYLLGYFFLYRKGKLDDKKIRVIYKFLPNGKK